MTAPPDLYVLCAGGHARVVIDILRRADRAVTALIDDDPKLHGTQLDDVPIVGNRTHLLGLPPAGVMLVNALGNTPRAGDSGLGLRRTFFTSFKDKGYRFEQVISPDAVLSQHAILSEGCHIITGAIVHPGCLLGANVIVNTGARLDHDCRIGPHSHIAPGAVVCGGVTVGAECHIGAGAVIVQGLSIGDGAVIAAGAVVVRDVAAGATIMGTASGLRAPSDTPA